MTVPRLPGSEAGSERRERLGSLKAAGSPEAVSRLLSNSSRTVNPITRIKARNMSIDAATAAISTLLLFLMVHPS